MAKSKIQLPPPDASKQERVVELARELYLRMAFNRPGKTAESVVKEAFQQSVVFWTHADKITEVSDG